MALNVPMDCPNKSCDMTSFDDFLGHLKDPPVIPKYIHNNVIK